MGDEGQEQEPRNWFQMPEPEKDGSCRHWMSNPAWCAICASERGCRPNASLTSPASPSSVPTGTPPESSSDPGKRSGSH
jgi:hypothetical protein